jgi:hypothetical protein
MTARRKRNWSQTVSVCLARYFKYAKYSGIAQLSLIGFKMLIKQVAKKEKDSRIESMELKQKLNSYKIATCSEK